MRHTLACQASAVHPETEPTTAAKQIKASPPVGRFGTHRVHDDTGWQQGYQSRFSLPGTIFTTSGLIADSEIPGGIRGFGRFPDVGRPWPIHGLDVVSTSSGNRTGHVCGHKLDLAGSYARNWIEHRFGQIAVAVADWTRLRPLDLTLLATFQPLQTTRWKLRRRFAGCCVSAKRTATRTSAVITRMLPGCCANRCADDLHRCVRVSRQLLGPYATVARSSARMIHRMLRG